MSSFDPATVRQAVAEFTPLRPQKFQDLIPANAQVNELLPRHHKHVDTVTMEELEDNTEEQTETKSIQPTRHTAVRV